MMMACNDGDNGGGSDGNNAMPQGYGKLSASFFYINWKGSRHTLIALGNGTEKY